MRLATIERRARYARGSRLAFLHGFTQTARSWEPIMARLVDAHDCLALDAPGHGASTDGGRTLWQCADDIAETAPGSTLVGYSMGARMALHAALAHPTAFAGLVLISGTPGIEDDDERAARRRADDALADHIETIGVGRFIDEWLAQPLFAGLPAGAAMREDRLRNTAHGLASSLRHAGTGTQQPLWSRLGEIRLPTLLVTGSRDVKFTDIGERMRAMIDGCEHLTVTGAGHTAHLEATEAVLERLRGWLDAQESAATRPTE